MDNVSDVILFFHVGFITNIVAFFVSILLIIFIVVFNFSMLDIDKTTRDLEEAKQHIPKWKMSWIRTIITFIIPFYKLYSLCLFCYKLYKHKGDENFLLKASFDTTIEEVI